ncbi:putative CAM kinase, SNF1 family [Neospora caninum Liverpool]|uniref:Putative CAM kinase, SNF1 family n=1 Tax=Neospora caninum (strain Liverpool) TaxID=572307 RepID=F0VC91_NEOCL|nr:putative CAM kinase, SNF1 family [Neospora caninum Liverpool]CBZ51225.1 putative CAM kinase, SNF1 family [Neospora caninum Liverpool]|eukprot:XP_003881258.1 putative CAM kinase, SNF1 family [Neospora caninum Liverpool]
MHPDLHHFQRAVQLRQEEDPATFCPVSVRQYASLVAPSYASTRLPQRVSASRSFTSSVQPSPLQAGAIPCSVLRPVVPWSATTTLGPLVSLDSKAALTPSSVQVGEPCRASLREGEERGSLVARAHTATCSSSEVGRRGGAPAAALPSNGDSSFAAAARTGGTVVYWRRDVHPERRPQSPSPSAPRASSSSPGLRVRDKYGSVHASTAIPGLSSSVGYFREPMQTRRGVPDNARLVSAPRQNQADPLGAFRHEAPSSPPLHETLVPLCTARYRPAVALPYSSQDGSHMDRPGSVSLRLAATATPRLRHGPLPANAGAVTRVTGTANGGRGVLPVSGPATFSGGGPTRLVFHTEGTDSHPPVCSTGSTLTLPPRADGGDRDAMEMLARQDPPHRVVGGSDGQLAKSIVSSLPPSDSEDTRPALHFQCTQFVGPPPTGGGGRAVQAGSTGLKDCAWTSVTGSACLSHDPSDRPVPFTNRLFPQQREGEAASHDAIGDSRFPSGSLTRPGASDGSPCLPLSSVDKQSPLRQNTGFETAAPAAADDEERVEGSQKQELSTRAPSAPLAKGDPCEPPARGSLEPSHRQTARDAANTRGSGVHTRDARVSRKEREVGTVQRNGNVCRGAGASVLGSAVEHRTEKPTRGLREAKRVAAGTGAQDIHNPPNGAEAERRTGRRRAGLKCSLSSASRVRTGSLARSGALTFRQSEEVGKRSMGQYTLGETIGEGTFGKVKLGIHVATQEQVAIKILEKSRIKEADDVERVVREIHILKTVRHPHIVRLLEIIETQQHLYLIMEYASGGELYDYIVNRQCVEEKEACKFFRQILSGVEEMHALRICHRDLKPENILLDADLNIKIVDFGLSNTYTCRSNLKTACGSPSYAAPEMIEGKAYEPLAVDIWSCGVILFALLAGYLPFEDASTDGLYRKIIKGEFECPEWISKPAEDLLRGLLDTDPKRRLVPERIKRHPWYNLVKETTGVVSLSRAGSSSLPPSFTSCAKSETENTRTEGRESRALARSAFLPFGCGIPLCSSCAQWADGDNPEAPPSTCILSQMACLGLDTAKAVEALQKGELTTLTAAYFLLLAKMNRRTGRVRLEAPLQHEAGDKPEAAVSAPSPEGLPRCRVSPQPPLAKGHDATLASADPSGTSPTSALHTVRVCCAPLSFSSPPSGVEYTLEETLPVSLEVSGVYTPAQGDPHSQTSTETPAISVLNRPTGTAPLRQAQEPALTDQRLPSALASSCALPYASVSGNSSEGSSSRPGPGMEAGETSREDTLPVEYGRLYTDPCDGFSHFGQVDERWRTAARRGKDEDVDRVQYRERPEPERHFSGEDARRFRSQDARMDDARLSAKMVDLSGGDREKISVRSDAEATSHRAQAGKGGESALLEIRQQSNTSNSTVDSFSSFNFHALYKSSPSPQATGAAPRASSSSHRPAAAGKNAGKARSARGGESAVPGPSIFSSFASPYPSTGLTAARAASLLSDRARVPPGRPAHLGPPTAMVNRARMHRIRQQQKGALRLPLSSRGSETYRPSATSRPRPAGLAGRTPVEAARGRGSLLLPSSGGSLPSARLPGAGAVGRALLTAEGCRLLNSARGSRTERGEGGAFRLMDWAARSGDHSDLRTRDCPVSTESRATWAEKRDGDTTQREARTPATCRGSSLGPAPAHTDVSLPSERPAEAPPRCGLSPPILPFSLPDGGVSAPARAAREEQLAEIRRSLLATARGVTRKRIGEAEIAAEATGRRTARKPAAGKLVEPGSCGGNEDGRTGSRRKEKTAGAQLSAKARAEERERLKEQDAQKKPQEEHCDQTDLVSLLLPRDDCPTLPKHPGVALPKTALCLDTMLQNQAQAFHPPAASSHSVTCVPA